MRVAAIAATTLAIALCGLSPAIGQGVLPAGPVQLGTVTGDPEKDSIGFSLAGQRHLLPTPACAVVRHSAEAVPVGPVTGDPEKDSIGFIRLADRDGCDGKAETPR